MILQNDKVILRPTRASDILDYQRWLLDEPDLESWDVSWNEEDDDDDEVFIRQLKDSVSVFCEIYHHLEVDDNYGRHIGWVSAYLINDRKDMCVGIDLPDGEKGQGCGEKALTLFLSYLFGKHDVMEIYTETLSGNAAMIRLAEKIGFTTKRVVPNVRELRGHIYDGLSFSIDRKTFFENYPSLASQV